MEQAKRKLGIWMDHASAQIIHPFDDNIYHRTIHSNSTSESEEANRSFGEKKMHAREQHQQNKYYKQLGSVIESYDDVILFGPTEAKTELFNTLKDDKHFAHVKIETQNSDKMTDNQKGAFVRDYFDTKNATN